MSFVVNAVILFLFPCLAACISSQRRSVRGAVGAKSSTSSSTSDDPDYFGPSATDISAPGIDSYLEHVRSQGASSDIPERSGPAAASRKEVVMSANASRAVPVQHVVVAKYDEDVSWLNALPNNWDVSVFQSKNSTAPRFVENYGNEASKYLSYIVEAYDNLPDNVAFVQAGRQDWHDIQPKDDVLSQWDWGRAASEGGLAFLPTAAPCLIEDTEQSSQTPDDAELAARTKRRRSVGFEERCPDVVEHYPKQMDTVKSVWSEVFEQELGPLPKHWLTHCCAQFEVTRDAIRRHPRRFYENLLQWTIDHDKSLMQSDYSASMRRGHDPERRDAGHVLEVTWALIFSDPAKRLDLS